MTCNHVSSMKMNRKLAQEECTNLQMYVNDKTPLDSIHWESLTNESLVWIGQTLDDNFEQASYCQAWSLRKLAIQSVPCDTELSVFCQADLAIESSAPSKTNLKIVPGDLNSIVFNAKFANTFRFNKRSHFCHLGLEPFN